MFVDAHRQGIRVPEETFSRAETRKRDGNRERERLDVGNIFHKRLRPAVLLHVGNKHYLCLNLAGEMRIRMAHKHCKLMNETQMLTKL